MTKAGWKGPDEPWERHSRPLARAALANARKAGWWLKKSSAGAKVWGVISCGDPSLPRDKRCSTTILSTSGAHDGSETAAHINDFVNSCPHDRIVTGENEVLAAAEALVIAGRCCLEAARSLIEARAHRDLVDDYLAQCEAATAGAGSILDQALTEDQLADRAETAASTAADLAGTSINLGPIGLAERARVQAGEARGLVADDTSRRARVIRHQCEDIRNNARALLAQLQ